MPDYLRRESYLWNSLPRETKETKIQVCVQPSLRKIIEMRILGTPLSRNDFLYMCIWNELRREVDRKHWAIDGRGYVNR